ncbi:hypothetical protein D3C84_802720 [compost metagenome]
MQTKNFKSPHIRGNTSTFELLKLCLILPSYIAGVKRRLTFWVILERRVPKEHELLTWNKLIIPRRGDVNLIFTTWFYFPL